MSDEPSPSTSIGQEPSDFAKRLAENDERVPLLTSSSNTPAPYSPNISDKGRTMDSFDLNRLQKYAFGLGHVMNDITGVLWFSYALLFLQVIVGLPSTVAAILFLLGQVTDAVATPIAGIIIDKWSTKKRWHFTGILLIAIGFPFIFHYWGDASWGRVFKYALAIVIFQLGWTLVQIAHLSLIPDMTIFLQERAELTTLRYTVFVCSNIVVYLMAYFILHDRRRDDFDIIEGRDGWKIEVIAILAIIFGIATSVIFQCILRTPESSSSKSEESVLRPMRIWQKVCRCCRSSKLLLVAAVHTTSRIFHSVNMVYIPFYINQTNVKEAGILAMAPFFSFIGALLSSLVIGYTSKVYSNNKTLYTVGTIISLMSCLCIFLNDDKSSDPTLIYAASLLYGTGSAMTVVKSLCIAANFIGNSTEDGAFIYGVITFFDKILNGIIIFVVEYIKCTGLIDYNHYYKIVLTIFNGLAAIIGYMFLQSLPSPILHSK